MIAAPVVLFDLDDTLFAHRASLRAGFARHLGGQPITVDDLESELDRWEQLEDQHYPRYLAGELDYLGQRRARSRDFVGRYGIDLAADDAADAWFAGYLDGYRESWMLHEDVAGCLEALRDIRLGIITNGDHDAQTAKVAALGISDRFEHVVASGELGVAKPDPAIFRAACERFGVASSDAWYVGDRLETDAVGAQAVGMRGVWIDRDSRATSAELSRAAALGVPVIGTLADLPELLGLR